VSDFDTMRWGDTQTLLLKDAIANPEGTPFLQTKQMLNAGWQRPLLWKVMLSIVPSIDAVDAGVPITVDVFYSIFVGVGQANAQIPLGVQVFAGPPYDATVQFFDIPAERIQMQFLTLVTPAVPANSTSSVSVSAFAAPFTEPRVLTDLRELMRHGRDIPDRDEPDNAGQQRWMGPDFNDGVMRYRK
jgi:hypothetical protein